MANFIICEYEDWMEDQVAQMFIHEYGGSEEGFLSYFRSFYDLDYQKEKCIRMVALDEKRVVGFQSYFFWPIKGIKNLNSYQSGNSLVHHEYRGKGIFRELLNHINERLTEKKVELLIGYPVQQSFSSFIKNGWNNPFDLNWYIKLVNPFAPLLTALNFKPRGNFSQDSKFDEEKPYSQNFIDWRKSWQKDEFYYYLYRNGEEVVEFEMKLQKRKKVINEFIIGQVFSNSNRIDFLESSLRSLVRDSRKSLSIGFLSCALNEKSSDPFVKVVVQRFKKISKKIYFISKNESPKDYQESLKALAFYRGDLDTW